MNDAGKTASDVAVRPILAVNFSSKKISHPFFFITLRVVCRRVYRRKQETGNRMPDKTET